MSLFGGDAGGVFCLNFLSSIDFYKFFNFFGNISPGTVGDEFFGGVFDEFFSNFGEFNHQKL